MARATPEFLMLVVLALSTSQAALADVFVHAKVGRKSATIPTCSNSSTTPNQGIGAGCQIPGDGGFSPVIGSASAQTAYGSLHTSAQLSSEDSDGASWEAIGFASYTDTLRIFAAGLAGTQGVAEFVFTTHTSDTRDADGLADGTFGVISEMVVKSDGNTRLIHSLSFPRTLPPFVATVFFFYGEPFELEVSLESKVTCTLCTGIWNGVSDATETAALDMVEVQGLDLEEFVVESLLGNEYANVVPEPGPVAGSLFAVLTLGMLRQQRRRARSALLASAPQS